MLHFGKKFQDNAYCLYMKADFDMCLYQRMLQIALISLLLVNPAIADSQSDDILEEILYWSLSVKSFSGNIQTQVTTLGHVSSDPDVAEMQLKELHSQYAYKMDGMNRYIEGICRRGETYIEFDGKMSKIGDRVKTYDQGVNGGQINGGLEIWERPSTGVVPLEILFGAYDWQTRLVDCYTNGAIQRYDLSASTIVYSFRVSPDSSQALDVYWDMLSSQVQRIDHVKRVDRENAQKLSQITGRPIFELMALESSMEIILTKSMNGVLIPIEAVITYFTYDRGAVSDLRKEREAGRLDDEGYTIAYLEVPRYAGTRMEVFVHPESVNVPIPKSEFEFEIPYGTIVKDKGRGEIYPLQPWWKFPATPRNMAFAAGGVVFLLVIIAGCFIVFRKRSRSAT